MDFLKSTKLSTGPLIATKAINASTSPRSNGNDSLFSDGDTLNTNNNNSANPLVNSLDSPLQAEWEINPELPRNMYMPCITTTTCIQDANGNKYDNKHSSNRIYIIGSHNNNQCWVYDTTYKTYEKLIHFPKKIIPKGHCVASCENIIFSTGGATQSKHLLFFNTISHEWHSGPNTRAKDWGIGSKCIVIPNKYLNDSMELHVIGGNRKPNKYCVYNRALKQWREGPKLPAKLTYHGVVYVGRNDQKQRGLMNKRKSVKGYIRDHRPQLIVFGGCNMKKNWTSALSPSRRMYRLYLHDDDNDDEERKYDHNGRPLNGGNHVNNNNNHQEHNKWQHIGDIPVAVQNFAYLCVLNNYILIFGGDLGDLKCSRNIYMYNIEKKTWKLLGIKLPDHLYGMTAIETKNGVIHLLGGHNGKSSQRLHLSIKTSKLLAKEFDEFDSSFTWKQLSRTGHQDINDDISLIDELKRVKRKLKDLEEKYNSQYLQCQQLISENSEIKQTNMHLLEKVAEAMQEKEEMSYEVKQIQKSSKTHHHGRSRSKSKPKLKKSPRTSRSSSRHRKKKKKQHNKNKDGAVLNPYIDIELLNELKLAQSNNNNNDKKKKIKIDPKNVLFRNFLFGRIGLPEYLNEFQQSGFNDICKMTHLNDQNLKLKVGISNELHRKLILRIVNEFKLEILQFKSWISSYDEEQPNLIQYISPFAKDGIISWHLLAQHISNKRDFKEKYFFIQSDDAIDCIYEHLIQFLDGKIPQPNPNKIKQRKKKLMQQQQRDRDRELNVELTAEDSHSFMMHINRDNHNHFNLNINNIKNNSYIDDNQVLFDDSGYHNW